MTTLLPGWDDGGGGGGGVVGFKWDEGGSRGQTFLDWEKTRKRENLEMTFGLGKGKWITGLSSLSWGGFGDETFLRQQMKQ